MQPPQSTAQLARAPSTQQKWFACGLRAGSESFAPVASCPGDRGAVSCEDLLCSRGSCDAVHGALPRPWDATLQRVALSVWPLRLSVMFSRFITSHRDPSLWLNDTRRDGHTASCVHSPTDGHWGVSAFWLLRTVPPWTSVRSLCVDECSLFSRVCTKS